LKILHLITTIERGGAEKQLLLLAKLQVMQGDSVVVAPLRDEPSLLREYENDGVSVYSKLLNKYVLIQVLKLFLLVKKENFDVVHAHLPRAELIGAILSLLTRLNFIVTKHNVEPFWPNMNSFLSSAMGRLVFRRAFRVIAISHAAVETMINTREITDFSKVRVVPYGYQPTLKARQNKQAENPPSALRICTVSRLVPQKNLGILLRACHILSELGVSISVKIIGDGSLRSQLKSLAHSLNLQGCVDWLGGKYSNPFEVIQNSDVFVLSSIYEGFGLVLLEALDWELTVVASRTSAIPEVLGEDYPLLFEPLDPIELAQRILQSANPELKESIRAHRENTLARFTGKKMILAMNDIYRERI